MLTGALRAWREGGYSPKDGLTLAWRRGAFQHLRRCLLALHSCQDIDWRTDAPPATARSCGLRAS